MERIGMTLELTMLAFDEGQYNYSILKTIEIKGRKQVYEKIETVFESLYCFTVSVYY